MAKGNVPRPITGAGPRLLEELEGRGKSVRSFQKELQEENVRGSSYSSVWSYLKGRVEPAPDFIGAAAAKLGLREEYLTTGELPKTSQKEQVEESGGALVQVVEDAVGCRLPSQLARTVVLHTIDRTLWLRLVQEDADSDGTTPAEEAAARVGSFLVAGLQALQVDARDLSGPAMDGFVLSGCRALLDLESGEADARRRTFIHRTTTQPRTSDQEG